jgi:hypothetical protein
MSPKIEQRLTLLGGVLPRDPMPEDELIEIEDYLGDTLPLDYRGFVKTYGAADFNKLVEFALLEKQPSHPVSNVLGFAVPRYDRAPFSHFYGSRSGNHSLARAIEALKGRMPETLIPIADDGGGNQICLGIKGQERGKVYYWDHNNEWDEEDFLEDYGTPMPPEVKFQNVYLAANSFEDFIDRLEVLEDQ